MEHNSSSEEEPKISSNRIACAPCRAIKVKCKCQDQIAPLMLKVSRNKNLHTALTYIYYCFVCRRKKIFISYLKLIQRHLAGIIDI